MTKKSESAPRVFKIASFSKEARKAGIRDDELREAIAEVLKGQADDLGGGVFKKRLNKNMHRSIVLAKSSRDVWVYQYLFAKKDRANIEDNELKALRAVAKEYANTSMEQWDDLVTDGSFIEICLIKKGEKS